MKAELVLLTKGEFNGITVHAKLFISLHANLNFAVPKAETGHVKKYDWILEHDFSQAKE